MERLTLERAICRVKMVAKNQRWNSKYTKVSPMNEELNKRHEADYIKDAEEHEQIAEWLEELKSYKNAEEQGLLVRLLCKVGDTVWDIDTGYPEPYKITAFSYGCHDLVGFGCDDDITFYYTSCRRQTAGAFLLSEIGKTVFLTREEAEKKLEEMEK